jgi:hypothetical protein
MKIKNLSYIFLLFVIVLICCNDDEESSNNYIIPTSIGNFWIFKVSYFDTLGNVTNCDTSKIEITRDTIINGDIWFELETKGFYVRNFSDGIYGFYKDKRKLIVKYPVKTGDFFINSTDDTTYVIESNISINVPKGKFNCVEYKSLYTGGDNVLRAITIVFLSPGIGNVKIEYYEITKSGRLFKNNISELIDYKIN